MIRPRVTMSSDHGGGGALTAHLVRFLLFSEGAMAGHEAEVDHTQNLLSRHLGVRTEQGFSLISREVSFHHQKHSFQSRPFLLHRYFSKASIQISHLSNNNHCPCHQSLLRRHFNMASIPTSPISINNLQVTRLCQIMAHGHHRHHLHRCHITNSSGQAHPHHHHLLLHLVHLLR